MLDGLCALLWRHRKQWEMVFALGGYAALGELRTSRFDAVVADMRMPEMNGAELLLRVQKEFPDVVRIVLSGQSDEETVMRSLPVTHQFLAKPCDAATLENTIDRACNLQALIADRRLREIVGGASSLPSRPAAYSALVGRLADPRVTAAEIAALLEQDMAMCAKLLQWANSAFFALPRRLTQVEEAVNYLGFRVIRYLALSASVYATAKQPPSLSLEALQQHALLSGNIARRIVKDQSLADDAFIAGMLHDVGILVLASRSSDRFDRTLRSLRERPRPVHAAEQELWGTTHAEIGAYLLGLWGLPYPLVEAVAYHHRPTDVPQRGLDLLAAVCIADGLAQEVLGIDCAVAEGEIHPIDEEYLASLGVLDSLEGWRAMARDLASAPAPGA